MTPTRRQVISATGAALAGTLLAGCSQEQKVKTTSVGDGVELLKYDLEREANPAVSTMDVGKLGKSVTNFGLDLHHNIVDQRPEENLVTSPYSASIALGMAWAGAEDTTETQMHNVLGYPYGQDKVHPSFNKLDQQIEKEPDLPEGADAQAFKLETVNSLWGHQDFPFSEGYLKTLSRNYGAGMHLVNMKDDQQQVRERINAWVADQTNDKITDLLGPGSITRMTRLVLTNAIYFKSNWQKQFDEENTADGQFTALDGTEQTVPMMYQEANFPYAEVDGTQVIELPYVGGDAGMAVFLPPEGQFEEFEQSLDAEKAKSLLDALESSAGEVTFPKFGYDAKATLSQTLSSLGMEDAFDSEEANFDGMVGEDADRDLFIQDVVQKAHIDVDEKGTEAAAATGVSMGTTSVPENSFQMSVDRPFVYLIRDRESDTALFLGRVVDAESAQ